MSQSCFVYLVFFPFRQEPVERINEGQISLCFGPVCIPVEQASGGTDRRAVLDQGAVDFFVDDGNRDRGGARSMTALALRQA